MKIFFELLQISLSGAFSVCYLLLLRIIFGKFPKRVTYLLWGLAAFHFISPIKPKWEFAVIPNIDVADGLTYAHINWKIIVGLYIAGIAVLLLINAVQYLRVFLNLKNKATQVEISGRIKVFRCEGSSSAFTFGFFPPKIYLPEGLDEESEKMIILHERMHIRRGDYWIKLIASVLCIINWYNPLVWVAFYFFTRDQEASCDELVLKKVGPDCKKQYANTIFQAATGFFVSGDKDHALAFGEANIKYRVRRCVKAYKPSKTVFAFGIVLTLAAFILGIFVSDRFGITFNGHRENETTLAEKDMVPGTVWETMIVPTGESYEICSNGIYLVADGKEEMIVHGEYDNANNFIYSDGGVLFITDNGRHIQRFDIYTHRLESVFECDDGKSVARFSVGRGILNITYNDDSTESRKMSVKQKVAATEKEILENKGTIYNVTLWTDDNACAFLDLNSDGLSEKIVLDFSLKDIEEKGTVTYKLLVGKDSVHKQVNNVSNNIYAVSFDGKQITLLFEYMIKNSESGKSEWYTAFYRYKDKLILSGEIKTALRMISIEDDTVNYSEPVNIIISERVNKTYKIDSEGNLTEQKSDDMNINQTRYQLSRALTVYESPESDNTFTVDAQTVDVYTVSNKCIRNVNSQEYEGYWVELTCENGTKGWIFVSDGLLPELGLNVQDVFTLGVYHHTIN